MSVRYILLSAGAASVALALLPVAASAQGLYIPAPYPDDTAPRETYRERMGQFPPPGGRLGGGIIEYVLTGGRPVPVAPEYAATVMPNIVKHPYARPGDRRANYGGTAAGPLRTAPGDAVAEPVYAPAPQAVVLPQGGLPPFGGGGAPEAYAPPTDGLAGYTALAPASATSAPRPAASLPAYSALAEAGPGPDQTGSEQAGLVQTAFAAPAAGSAVDFDPLGLGALLSGQQPAFGAPDQPALAPAPRAVNPIYQRQIVTYAGGERPGTIVIDTPDKFLYLVEDDGRAIRYGIGVGRPGFTWAGVKTVSRKAEWPGWTPPPQMLKRRPDLPRHMVGGEANPLGARALYLGSSMYRIHGTSEPDTIGTNVSSGCIRMTNADVTDLYDRVRVGTRVIVR